MSKNAPILKSKTHCKGFRLSIGNTKLHLIIGFYNLNESINWHRHGLLPYVNKTGWEKGFIQTSSYGLWVKRLCILFYKYQDASKFLVKKDGNHQ